MDPITRQQFSDDYQKFVLQKEPLVDAVKHRPPAKPFSLEESQKNRKKGKDKESKDDQQKKGDEDLMEDSPWIPKPRKKT